MDDRLLFYDIEVFPKDALVVFKNINNEEAAHFWTVGDDGFSPADRKAMGELIREHTLVGYNNHYYDDYVLTEMLREDESDGKSRQACIKGINDQIIRGEKPTFKFDKFIEGSLDCMQQIDVSHPSLKKIEGNLGKSVLESEIPFDYPEHLTDEQKETVHKYCSYDVENTIEVFKLRKENYFDIREALLDMVEKGRDKLRRVNTTTISAKILLGDANLVQWSGLRMDEMLHGVPAEVYDLWKKAEKKEKVKALTIDEFGCTITFGLGGLHGIATGQKIFHNVKLLDVGSMYPSIITLIEALDVKGTKTYDELRKERLRIKHSDPVRAKALKLILNSVYGNLKNQYSPLNNPMAALTVCAYGQAALYDLCKMLNAAGYQVMNINTDGVGFTDNNDVGDKWKEVQEQWEKKWQLYLELDEFDVWIQKDVNNYIARQGDHIKVKGGDLNKYESDNFFSNNNARIIHIAVAEKLINGKDIYKTIREHLNEPKLFQYVVNAGATYIGTCDENGVLLPQKVNRVFPVWEDTPDKTRLYKLRPDGGKVLFPDMSEHLKIWNDDVSKYTDFSKEIDIDFYAAIANKKLEGWR